MLIYELRLKYKIDRGFEWVNVASNIRHSEWLNEKQS